jgi:hypothetical protein
MKEAKDHSRVSPEGRAIGLVMARLADIECAALEKDGEPDDRCTSCAFRAGTVPNGCFQTQSDVVKAVAENKLFMCHSFKDANGNPRHVCHGWFAVRRVADRMEKATGTRMPAAPWEFSPPDPVESTQ